MRTLSPKNHEIKLRELIDAAREEPVTVLADGERAVVVLSTSEFDRLEEQDRIRRDAKERLRDLIATIQREAAERGLTEDELNRLLVDEK